MSTRPAEDRPRRRNRTSCAECVKSGPSSASGSANTVMASSNETPCFRRLETALPVSHSNTIQYIQKDRHSRGPEANPQRSDSRKASASSSRPRPRTIASTTPTPASTSSFSTPKPAGSTPRPSGGPTSPAGPTKSASSTSLRCPSSATAVSGPRSSRQLQAEASAAGKPLRIHVERFNPALRLYERLGFRLVEDRGIYLFLEWRARIDDPELVI